MRESKYIRQILAMVSTPETRQNAVICPKYNLLVTSYKGLNGYRELVLRSEALPKQLLYVSVFDPIYNVALVPITKSYDFQYEMQHYYLPSIGQHIGVYVYTFSEGFKRLNGIVLKFTERSNIAFFHVKMSMINQLMLGSLVVDSDNRPLGIVVNIFHENRVEVLPIQFLIQAIADYFDYSGSYAFRCPYCAEILTTDMVSFGKCAFCGEVLPENLYRDKSKSLVMSEHQVKVESIIEKLNYKPKLARLELNFWEIEKSNVRIIIHLDEKADAIVAYSSIFDLDDLTSDQKANLMTFLLEENEDLEYLSFSINKNKVFISTFYIPLKTLIPDNAIEIFRHLIAKASEYKLILAEKFLQPQTTF